MKRLLYFWILSKPKEGIVCRLSPSQRGSMSKDIVYYCQSLPFEFKRKCRNLDFLEQWKATEYRTFLLYIGPIVIPSYFDEKYVRHFKLFHFAITCLSVDNCRELIHVASACIKQFVKDVSHLYHERYIVYNFHILLHLPTFCAQFGPLDLISAFPFENHLRIVKRHVRSPFNPISQILSRSEEVSSLPYTSPERCIKYSHTFPNNFVLGKDRCVYYLSESGFPCKGYKMVFNSSLYNYPYDSMKLKIGIYEIGDTPQTFTVKCKCIGIKISDCKYVIMPFVNARYFG